jgi:hypothetical protein
VVLELVIVSSDDQPAILPDAAEGDVQAWREEGQVCAYGYAAGGFSWLHLPGVASYRFSDGDQAVIAVARPSVRPDLVVDGFERSVLPMALQALGHEVLHASAVLGPQGVLALCGDSGAGKSTLARVLNLRGYPLWADDAVAFECSGDAVHALPLPFRLNLRPPSLAAFGAPSGELDRSVVAGRAPLAAVFIIQRNATARLDSSLRRPTPAEAFRAALAQGYCYRPDDAERTGRMIREYLELVARVPVFQATLEEGLDQVEVAADRIEHVMAGAL